jgi:hypothetical protein
MRRRPGSVYALLDHHRHTLKPQFPDSATIGGREIRIADARLREARQQPRHRDADSGATQDVADAMVRAGAEATPGIRVQYALNDQWTFRATVFNGDPAGPEPGPGNPVDCYPYGLGLSRQRSALHDCRTRLCLRSTAEADEPAPGRLPPRAGATYSVAQRSSRHCLWPISEATATAAPSGD